MGNFDRRFPESGLKVLKERPAWWRDVLDYRFEDMSGALQPLFLAVRDGYLNAYVEGQSVLKIGFRNGDLEARIHHKYIKNGAEGQAYKVFDGKTVDDLPYAGRATLSEWVERARVFARRKGGGRGISEKQGVSVIAGRNSHVIDVEMALPGVVADRIDVVALERAGPAINIVFYEAKLFSNKNALRARSVQPKVLEQLGRYEQWLGAEDRQQEVTSAYRKTCRLLRELREMQGNTDVHELIVTASKDGSDLRIDPKPRLIVFGYEDSQAGHFWKPHEDALRNQGKLGNHRFIMQPLPEDVRLPEDANQKGWIDVADDILLHVEGPEALAEAQAAAQRK